MRKDKQLFRELDNEQLDYIVQGLDLLLDAELHKDLSVVEVRPIYVLKRKAQEEMQIKAAQAQAELRMQRKIIRAATEELINEDESA